VSASPSLPHFPGVTLLSHGVSFHSWFFFFPPVPSLHRKSDKCDSLRSRPSAPFQRLYHCVYLEIHLWNGNPSPTGVSMGEGEDLQPHPYSGSLSLFPRSFCFGTKMVNPPQHADSRAPHFLVSISPYTSTPLTQDWSRLTV